MRAEITLGVILVCYLVCTYGQDPGDDHVVIRTRKLTFVQDIWPMLVPYLNASGHQSQDGPSCVLALKNVTTAYTHLVNVQSKMNPNMKLVMPGDHRNSFLWKKLTGGSNLVGMRMPVNSSLSDVDLAEIKVWIDEGALFQLDSKGVVSVPGPNGGVIRGGNVVSSLDSTILAILGTLAVISAVAGFMYIKTVSIN